MLVGVMVGMLVDRTVEWLAVSMVESWVGSMADNTVERMVVLMVGC